MDIQGGFAFSGIDPATHLGNAWGAFSKFNWNGAGNGHDYPRDNAGITFEFYASRSWTGETSATPHQHHIDITTSSGGTGTNDVDNVKMVPI